VNWKSRLQQAADKASAQLLREATADKHWVGKLSASALSTATAVMALSLVAKHGDRHQAAPLVPLVTRGLIWLAEHQNADGGWGDTVLSKSNIATTMLARAAFAGAAQSDEFATTVQRAIAYIDAAGGVAAVHARYGKDRTFSAPILTQCALAGLVDWREVAALPFELGCLPHQFYKTVKLPVVSYALPALIAIGQVRHAHAPPSNPVIRHIRDAAAGPTLRLLERIQPASGGFLEATPLTSFVVMSLVAMGRHNHPVVQQGLKFLVESAQEEGCWPIDTNLATWVTTLSVNALTPEQLPIASQTAITEWLLGQQLKTIHPYTQAAPGGWAWTNLSGGVPDADDTPGAILALLKLAEQSDNPGPIHEAVTAGVSWLVELQNRDGGWPTFCKGWGALPFDRSAADLTAHALRALHCWSHSWEQADSSRKISSPNLQRRVKTAQKKGLNYLERQQRPDGSWLPLWFGNQDAPDDINPLYGTARVLLAYQDLALSDQPIAQRGIQYLVSQQNSDGGWGGMAGIPSTVEETALALEALLPASQTTNAPAIQRGLEWLVQQVETHDVLPPSPIGFYFAKLWYYERLYPQVFTVAALNQAIASGEEVSR